MAFVQRLITTSFTLNSGTFAGTGSNTLTVSGLRASAKIVKAGGATQNMLELRVWGMAKQQMDQLSTLGMVFGVAPGGAAGVNLMRNLVSVEAGDAQSGMTLVFSGTITNCYADYNSQPDVALIVTSQAAAYEATASAPTLSYSGRASVVAIMQQLANQMGLPFENNLPADIFISNPALSGSAWNQVRTVARAANIMATIDDHKLVIAPSGTGIIASSQIPLISPTTGMEGYPTYVGNGGIRVKTLFNPAVRFFSQVQIQSSITAASGTWLVAGLNHTLESMMIPPGQWHSELTCFNPSLPTPVTQ